MFVLNSSDPVPLYKQLYNQFRERILSGKLAADTKLPSVRALADELSASRNTVDGAYQELYAEGFIYSRPRSGFFVSPLEQHTTPQPAAQNDRATEVFARAADYRFDFHPARLDLKSFPAQLWRKLFSECLRDNPDQLSQYCDPQGEQLLRVQIQSYLERSRGVVCEPDQIIITAGLQQSLDILANILKEQHAVMAVEDPGFPLARTVFENRGYEIVSVAVGASGIDLDALKASDSSIVYVTPSHQMPLGSVMPVANRLRLIEWAGAGSKYIIEDDYDSELRYNGKPISSLQGLQPHGNIIYLGTFSKVLSPALRMSYMVLPHSLRAAYQRRFRDFAPSVPLLEQRILASFIEQGHWERHIRRMRTIYKKKHETILRAIEASFGDRAEIIGQGAGLHLVLQLNASARCEAEIIGRAEEHGLRLLPFSWTCAEARNDATRLFLGFGGMTSGEITEGIALLSRICF